MNTAVRLETALNTTNRQAPNKHRSSINRWLSQAPSVASSTANIHAASVTGFCRSLKICRCSFYTIRARYVVASPAALYPPPSAAHKTQRVYDEVVRVMLKTRSDLKARGWDDGRIAIRCDIAASRLRDPPILSV